MWGDSQIREDVTFYKQKESRIEASSSIYRYISLSAIQTRRGSRQKFMQRNRDWLHDLYINMGTSFFISPVSSVEPGMFGC